MLFQLFPAVADEFVCRSIDNLSKLYDALLTIEYQFADPSNAFVLNLSPNDNSVAEFEKRMGISASTLHRTEMCRQNVTLDMLDTITNRLKVSISDIFGDQKK